MFLCGFPTELATIIDFAQAKSNKKIGQTRFSSTCFESRLSLKGGCPMPEGHGHRRAQAGGVLCFQTVPFMSELSV